MPIPQPAPDLVPVRRALLSVSDKTGLLDLAQGLHDAGVELISTGGTAKAIQEHGLPVRDVSALTGFAEMMDGRVKTLHPAVHGGLLALRNDESHMRAAHDHGIAMIDLVYINLYPFEQTIAAGADFETCIENIDIGGPAMLRAAAKNHGWVSCCTNAQDVRDVLSAMAEHDGQVPLSLRKHLSAATYARTAAYDGAIAAWYSAQLGEDIPAHFVVTGTLRQALRYGENPHQSAAFYGTGDLRPGIATARQVQGKALSYNNLNDTDAAFELVCEFSAKAHAAVAIIKHANPCGVAIATDTLIAYDKALACDSVSAFGGIVAVNQTICEDLAKKITQVFTEVVIAPDADEAALAVFAAKPNLRVLLTGALADPASPGRTVKSVAGGLLVQDRDFGRITTDDLKTVTKIAPDAAQMDDLIFAWRVAKHVKSNTIVYAKNGATVGVGAGQMSRVDAARIAAIKAEDAAEKAGDAVPATKGCVAASDAFFPFADGLLQAASAGAIAVIQPGGSIRDDEVIAAADEARLAMVFTGMRHFRH
ncbi:MAG: bifunctional phosphoribosylaminoimidazolecarboxamide formyltransferase/inosine monophosphate cyclohydrolase [Robiginitomaculum sp.]|nr:MAG: bifunctional phosphoribosylaminoimidazolecarboxamide formyltransferase/inosine monophosphate cyclohydrolase [Robiginitomaculum sp.]